MAAFVLLRQGRAGALKIPKIILINSFVRLCCWKDKCFEDSRLQPLSLQKQERVTRDCHQTPRSKVHQKVRF
ncbi:hypothetical protein QTO34_014868 [Cnephaeus nilssonii]|uniref:Uncharacterized protein n=1 Tax=Cnephaeus nilssonii TaxID=3371016 RepID=A0AA40I763_CNENI|nr:hypothetical protein QTO34_014868 [Eptesicus nilssonii]